MSCTATASSIRARTSSERLSYAAAMSAHIVSPPNGGVVIIRRIAPIAGAARNDVSTCQMFS